MTETNNNYTIQRLSNSFHFGMNLVFILETQKKYQLICLNDETGFSDYYHTLRGAKIAFTRIFQDKFDYHDTLGHPQAKWTGSYSPDPLWLEEKQSFLNENETTLERLRFKEF